MTSLLAKSPLDRILWILANNGGKMGRSRLRRRVGWKYSILDPVLRRAGKGRQDYISLSGSRVAIYR